MRASWEYSITKALMASRNAAVSPTRSPKRRRPSRKSTGTAAAANTTEGRRIQVSLWPNCTQPCINTE